MQLEFVNGLAYYIVPPAPEAELAARMQTAHEVFERRIWREDVARWEQVVKPAAIRAHLTLQAVDPASLGTVHRDPETSVIVLEYEVRGASVKTGRPYNNRFVSILTINDRKVTHWRDYLDPVAVFDASGWPQGLR